MRETLRRTAILLLLCAVLTAGKKSPAPDPAYDPAANFALPKSYAWIEGPAGSKSEGNSIVDARFVDRHVRAAVEANLGKKGFAKVATDPSFYVAYRESAAGGQSQNKWEVPPSYAIDEPWLQAGSITQPTPNPAFVADSGTRYRKRSTLVLDILDSRKKLIWRGSRTSNTGTNPDELAKGIDHAVARLLEKFPPRTAGKAR
jgi:hypothetical protein